MMLAKPFGRLQALLLVVGLMVASAHAAELPKTGRSGPLAQLPSAEGAHLAKIRALGANQWLALGAPTPDPKWGKARCSAWGAKAMAFAPKLGGAFLWGEGVHAYVKPDGHVMDDLWFYDANAHAWICLYPGTNTETFNQQVQDGELRIDDHGSLCDKNGQAIPVHTSIHAWGALAYDTDRNKLAMNTGDGLNRYFLGGEAKMDAGLKLLEAQLVGKTKTVFSPWFYDASSCKFERIVTANKTPADAAGFPQFHYIPAERKFYAVGNGTVLTFDPAVNLWTDLVPKGPTPAGYDAAGCYDSKRGRIYRNDGDEGAHKGLMAYDMATNTWLVLNCKGPQPEPQNTNGTYYEYDPDLDLVIVIQMRGASAGVNAYDPSTNTWRERFLFPDHDGPEFQFAGNTFFDRKLNAYFCHIGGDSSDDGVVWAYRFKRRD